jgi:hypothetical protein
MKSIITTLFILISAALQAQQTDQGINSITGAELRDHIFFLASDSMNGRVSTTPEYAVAAQYVAAQFAAAGVTPAVNKDGVSTYMHSLPFIKTVYNDQFSLVIKTGDKEIRLVHKDDFKVLMGNQFKFEGVPMVYVGYGISEPEHGWNDLKDVDLQGKLVVCLAGAPQKNGKPELPKSVNDKYTGQRGMYTKLFSGMGTKGAVGFIVVDPEGKGGLPYEEAQSRFTKERTVYQGAQRSGRMGAMSTVFLVKPSFLETFTPKMIDKSTLTGSIEVLSEEPVQVNNVIGIIPGTDPVLKDEYIVIGGHLDHVAPQRGNACNGADDNASGSAGVIEAAEAIAMNPCKRSVIVACWAGEEMGLLGSAYFLQSNLFPKDQIKFNINLDMIGRTGKGNEKTRAHYAVTDKKYVQAIGDMIKEVNQGITDFPILIDDDEHSPGGSDHMTFIQAGIPAFFFFSGVHADLHTPGDDPDKIDYPKAEKVTRLAYLIAEKLANLSVVPDFK